MSKKSKNVESFNLQKEVKLIPGYFLSTGWVLFTFIVVGWVVCASLISSSEIFGGSVLRTFWERQIGRAHV